MVYRETRGARSTPSAQRANGYSPSNQSVSRTDGPPPGMNLEMEGFSTRRSSCLWFQMFSVETHSFLPDGQSDRSDLPRQSEARHRWLQPFGNERSVEVLERSGDSGGPHGRPLEDIFQIVVMVFVEPADS